MARDRSQHQGGVRHVLRNRTDLVERRRKGHQPIARHAPVSRFEPNHPAARRRLSDGSTGIGAERGDALVGSNGSGRSAARPSGDVGQVPGIPARSERRIFGRRPHGEFVEIGLSDQQKLLCPESIDHRRIVGRDKISQNAGRTGRRHPLGADIILDGDGHSHERRGMAPAFQLLVQRLRVGHGRILLQRHVRLDLGLDLVDPERVGVDDLSRRDLPGGEFLL